MSLNDNTMYSSRLKALLFLLMSPIGTLAQKPQYPPAFPPTPARPILPSSANYAPSVTPNVMDLTAPSAQAQCPGYTASNVKTSDAGLTADLTLAGPPCSVYGNDIQDLALAVEYQSKHRLAVRITPKFLVPANTSDYILDENLTPYPTVDKGSSKNSSNLLFTWSNDPSFQFKVSRVDSGEVIFDTYGNKIVFEDQFLELKTSMVPDYNVYGFAESLRGFRIGNNFTQTFWNAYNLDNDQELDVNGHSVHPMYLETRYHGTNASTSHGVYARNAHGQDWLLRNDSITYRTIGGTFDFYFLDGPTPKEVISQYHTEIVGTPVMQPYWALGFHQVRWSYQNWTNLQDVLDAYAAQNIQVEGIMNDLDYLKVNRDFTNNPGHYDLAEGKAFLDRLHANGQYYLPILDPNIYVPNPNNASDAYPTYDRGAELEAYIRTGNNDSSFYIGIEWPGFSVWPDFLVQQAHDFWTNEIQEFHKALSFDGFWLDVSDAVSFCTGSCGTGMLEQNPIHVPFALPGDPNTSIAVDYHYPEMFNITNATEAASASSLMASQSLAYPTPLSTPTPLLARTLPTPGIRNLTFPPYAINNFLAGHSLVKQSISPDATHNNGPYNSTEYSLHNLYGHLSANATYHSLLQTYNHTKRPFFISRSTFAGSGTFTGHWGGDTNSEFGNMYFGISQALQFSIAGIPYFGVETCGFNGNADMELCTRWMQLSSWFPLYRNHNNRNTIAQEAYRWSTTAEATRRVMDVRYSLLPYTYTLFHRANVAGETVLRALAWEFPDDEGLKAVETQFLSGPAVMVIPVLAPLATSVQGVFPGVGEGTRWFDWYTFDEVKAEAGENKTIEAELVHQPVFLRGGYVVPVQRAGNTTRESRKNGWSLIVALDKNDQATGELYLDDGISLYQNATKNIQFNYTNATLTTTPNGTYNDNLPLSNITITGLSSYPTSIYASLGNLALDISAVSLICGGSGNGTVSGMSANGTAMSGGGRGHNGTSSGVLYIRNLESMFGGTGGVWSADFKLGLLF